MSSITVEKVRKLFGRKKEVVAVDDVSLMIAEGEFFVIVGPSGSGKTSLLRLIAGLEEADGGRIYLDDEDVTNLRPRDRDIAMVFQDYALYPQLKVRDNIAFGLRRRKAPKAHIQAKVTELAGMLRLEELLDRRPGQLSGGERQRVALARAIAREPRAFLMDEPLSNLDANLRTSTRAELAQLHQRLRTTTVLVTHDQVDAMSLGERVAVMRDGRVEQLDTPTGLYERPVSLFVAAFIGSPSINLVETEIKDGRVRIGDAEVPVGDIPEALRADGRPVIAGIRPADLEDEAFVLNPDWPKLSVAVTVRQDFGSDSEILFAVDARPVHRDDVSSALAGGDVAEVDLVRGRDVPMFAARVNAKSAARVGQSVRMAIDPTRLYLFDRDSGSLIAGPSGHEGTAVAAQAPASE
jgi:multiple sugar transport system ATP-binding protein